MELNLENEIALTIINFTLLEGSLYLKFSWLLSKIVSRHNNEALSFLHIQWE
jgi:hypothetical protein